MSKPNNTQLEQIASYIAQSITVPQLVQHYDKSMIFSTDEVMVGQWINGKPIYQRTLDLGQLTNSASAFAEKLVSVGASVETYVKVDLTYGSENWISAEYTEGTNNTIFVSCYTNAETSTGNKNKAGVIYKGTMSWVTVCRVIVYYTKTTDSALTYKLGTENDYTMEKQLIGHMKTNDSELNIFRKMYLVTMPNNASGEITLETFPSNAAIFPIKDNYMCVGTGFYTTGNSYASDYPALNTYFDKNSKTLKFGYSNLPSNYQNHSCYIMIDWAETA